MFSKLKKAVTTSQTLQNIFDEINGGHWKRTSLQLGKELVEINLKLKEAEEKIVMLELALAEAEPEALPTVVTH